MPVSAAVTIKRSKEEVAALLAADPLLSSAQAEARLAVAPGDRGTELRVRLADEPAGGALGQKVAAILGSDPQRRLDDALRRFKQVLETGEVVRSEGSPGGTQARKQRNQEPAAPAGSGS